MIANHFHELKQKNKKKQKIFHKQEVGSCLQKIFSNRKASYFSFYSFLFVKCMNKKLYRVCVLRCNFYSKQKSNGYVIKITFKEEKNICICIYHLTNIFFFIRMSFSPFFNFLIFWCMLMCQCLMNADET